jgi:Rod binding domain-containing protein
MDITQVLLTKPYVMPPEPPPRVLPPAAGEDPAQTAEQLRQTARQFETVFLHQILKQMKESVDYASLDEEDESGEQIQSMYWSFMADSVGQQGGLGFWKAIYEDMATAQGIDTRRYPADECHLDERA